MEKQLKTFILDDEADNVNELLRLLEPYKSKLAITHIATTFEEAVRVLTLERFDLSLVDFALDAGRDLLDLVKVIDKRNFGLIGLHSVRNGDFKTASVIGDFTYLMKPFEPIGVAEFVNKVLSQTAFGHSNRHPVKHNHSTLLLSEDDIYYIESDNKLCTYVCREGGQIPRKIIVTSSLTAIESELGQFQNLIRCHKSYIINTRYFIEFRKVKDAGEFTITINGREYIVPYSSSYKDLLIMRGVIPR